jgi:hypothetical protein
MIHLGQHTKRLTTITRTITRIRFKPKHLVGDRTWHPNRCSWVERMNEVAVCRENPLDGSIFGHTPKNILQPIITNPANVRVRVVLHLNGVHIQS